MVNRLVRIACVLLVAAIASHGCIYKKPTGPGTNVGSGLGREDNTLPPPGMPSVSGEEER